MQCANCEAQRHAGDVGHRVRDLGVRGVGPVRPRHHVWHHAAVFLDARVSGGGLGRGEPGAIECDVARGERLLEHPSRHGRGRLRREVAALARIVDLHDHHKLRAVGGKQCSEAGGVLAGRVVSVHHPARRAGLRGDGKRGERALGAGAARFNRALQQLA